MSTTRPRRNEAPFCRGAEVVVVGGGNSAGQAAVFLASIARKVYLIIRGDDLYANMSTYLARRIEQTPNIEVLLNTTCARCGVTTTCARSRSSTTKPAKTQTLTTAAVFSFIGASPAPTGCRRRSRRTPKSSSAQGRNSFTSPHWTAKREPFLLETSRAGVFAAGDVRADSIKRVASAVGEGAMAVKFVHEYLKAM